MMKKTQMNTDNRAVITNVETVTETMVDPFEQSSLSIMTQGLPPSDTLRVVKADTPTLGISTKLQGILSGYKNQIKQTPSTDCAGSTNIMDVPRSMLDDVVQVIAPMQSICGNAIVTAITMINAVLLNLNANATFCSVNRATWDAIINAYAAVLGYETQQRIYSAGASVCKNIANDYQSKPVNKMLEYSLESEPEVADQVIDPEFLINYPLVPLQEMSVSEAVNETIDNSPNTLGLTGSPATNEINVDLNEMIERSAIDSVDGTSLNSEVSAAWKRFCSGELLTTALRDLIPQVGLPSIRMVKTKVTYDDEEGAEEKEIKTMMMVFDDDLTGIDMNKSILDQDWSVTPASATMAKLKYGILGEDENRRSFSVKSVLDAHAVLKTIGDIDDSIYVGCATGRAYNTKELRGLASSLTNLWGKYKTKAFKTLDVAMRASEVVAYGLGAIGKVTQTQGLINASNVMNVLNGGLHLLKPLVPKTKTDASIVVPTSQILAKKHMTSIFPSLAIAGMAALDNQTASETRVRGALNFINNQITNEYVLKDTSSNTRRAVMSATRRTGRLGL